MNKKPIKLSPKKGGNGYVTSYSINIGSAEARECGFTDTSDQAPQLEKIVDPEHHRIIIQLAKEGNDHDV